MNGLSSAYIAGLHVGSRLNEWERVETAGLEDSPASGKKRLNNRAGKPTALTNRLWGRGESRPLSHNAAPAWATGHHRA